MYRLHDLLEKIKPFYSLLIILVVASIFFALGRISALESNHTPIKIEYPNSDQTSSVIQSISTTSPRSHLWQSEVMASKNGTKYYFPWCGSAKNIKPENIIKFASVELAKKAGYTPAANCKGLK